MKKNGFTLMEMLIVVAIIGLLVAIAVPVFSVTMDRTRKTACDANMRNAKMVLSLKSAEEGKLTDSQIEEALTSGLGKTVTKETADGKTGWKGLCPAGGVYVIDSDTLVIECSKHGKMSLDKLTSSDDDVRKAVDTIFNSKYKNGEDTIFTSYFKGKNAKSLDSTGGNFGEPAKKAISEAFKIDIDSFDFRLYYDPYTSKNSCKIYLFDPLNEGMIDKTSVACKGFELKVKEGENGQLEIGEIINRVEGDVAVKAGSVDGKKIPVIDAASIQWKK